MVTSTVCTLLTETPIDQSRELSNERKSLAKLDIVIEVGKAVCFVTFSFYKLLTWWIFIYSPFYIAQVKSRNLDKSKPEKSGKNQDTYLSTRPPAPALFWFDRC